jgi:hypothetical protein
MKITLKAWIIVGLMAATFIIVLKWIAKKIKVPGLQSAVAAA